MPYLDQLDSSSFQLVDCEPEHPHELAGHPSTIAILRNRQVTRRLPGSVLSMTLMGLKCKMALLIVT